MCCLIPAGEDTDRGAKNGLWTIDYELKTKNYRTPFVLGK